MERERTADALANKDLDCAKRIADYEAEAARMAEERNKEMDSKLKIETVIDEKNDRIAQLERELARKEDEVNLRKEVIDSMGTSLLKHETESRELASKLVMLKNQIMENDIGRNIGRKFAAVKLGMMKSVSMTPVSVSFIALYLRL
jgi:chromosome segregation ATPase